MFTIGIPAHNEADSIAAAIWSLVVSANLARREFEIIVVASGCEDATVVEAQRALSAVRGRVLVEETRAGKCSALNLIVANASGSIVVFCDADVCVEPGALPHLLSTMEADDSIGLVYGRMEVVVGRSWLWSALARQSAAALHAYRLLPGQAGSWMVCGYLFAVRCRSWEPIPAGIVVDDVFVGESVQAQGFNVRYEDASLVFVRYPQTLRDYVAQKLRNRMGRQQLPVVVFRRRRRPRWVGLDALRRSPITAVQFLPVVLVDGLLTATAWAFLWAGRQQTELWLRIKTTKQEAS